jgi:hypothetical protein
VSKKFRLTSAATGVVAAVAMLMAIAASGAGAASDTLPTLNLTMDGKSIAVSGAEQSGAVNIVSTVTTKAGTAPTLVRLEPGVSFAEAFSHAAQDPNNLRGFGEIVFGTEAAPGTSSAQTVLAPGHYVALDTSGNNPADWPKAQFDVTAASAPASLPKPAASVSAIEFGFKGAGVLHQGSLVRFQNSGFLVHMIAAVRVRRAADAKKVVALLKAGKDRQVQKLASGFVQPLGAVSPGAIVQENLTAPRGTYVLACFMSTQDGREHTRLGMEKIVKIVK